MDDAMPKIVELPGFRVIGLELTCRSEDVPKIPGLWEELTQKSGALPPVDGFYGVCLPVEGDPHAFRYLACARAAEDAPLPEGFAEARVPAAKYAVFPFKGQPAQMSQAFGEIFTRRLAAAGLNADKSGPCLEQYPDDCMDEATGEIKADLYVAVA